MPANLENSAVATEWKRSVFIPIIKKGNVEEYSNYLTIILISHAKYYFEQNNAQNSPGKALAVRELGTYRCSSWTQKRQKNQRSNCNIRWITEKAREFQKNTYLCFTDFIKPFDCVDHNKLWEALKEMGIPEHHACLLRNLYVGQEATVWTLYGNNWLVQDLFV